MKYLLSLTILVTIAFATTFSSCGGSGAKTFCDTSCANSDTMRFSKSHELNPVVLISRNNCAPRDVIWSHDAMETMRKMSLSDLAGKEVLINEKYLSVTIQDTSYAWVIFNECMNGQGFAFKIPYDKSGAIFRKNSALNRFDPKFHVDESLVAYTDRGNIFVEELATGRKAMMTFGVNTNMDYEKIHESLDSIHITPTRIWAKVKIEDDWKERAKDIQLQ